MKNLLSILITLLFFTPGVLGQTVSKEIIKQQIEAFKFEVYKSTDVFLNPGNSLQARINAVKPYPYIYDEAQVAATKKIALNELENPELRAVALNKLVTIVSGDELLGTSVIKWVQNTNTPKVLRDQSLNTIKELSFSGFSMFSKRQELTNALRSILQDPDLSYRQFAFQFLLAHGDSFAQNLLITQLNNNQTNLLPTPEAIRVLALNPHGDYLPSVYRYFQNSASSKETIIESIAVLGKYPPAKAKIFALLKNKKQDKDIRMIALATINSNYPAEFSSNVEQLLLDDSEPEHLRVAAIVMETYKRQSNQQKAKRKTADNFDKNVKQLSQLGKSAVIREASKLYLEKVEPNL